MSASTVVYIVGSGRSGSTLLERILGQVPGFVNVGEVIDIFRRVVDNDELCGCGQPFLECDFWTQVGHQAFGGWSTDLVKEVADLQRSVARHRHLARLSSPTLQDTVFKGQVKRYGDIYGRLYEAVLAVSGGQVVVDASKGAAQAVAISTSQLVDMRVIHLVRDARGVAFSWAKSGVDRPQGNAPGATMAQHRPALTAVRWSGLQVASEVARRAVPLSAVLRYEDLMTDPAAELVRVLRRLDLADGDGQLAHVDGSSVDLRSSHGVSGNPSRFRDGRQRLRRDDQWRHDMRRSDRVAATALALAPLARYGYLGRRNGDVA